MWFLKKPIFPSQLEISSTTKQYSINMVNVLSGIFNYSSSVLLLLHTGSTAASTRIPSFGVPFFNRNMIDGHSYLQDVQDTFRPSAMES